MIRTSDLDTITDGNVHGTDGEKIGPVGQVYLDNDTGEPEWVTVKTGLFGTKETFIPLSSAKVDGSDLRVPFTKATVKDAPKIDADGELSPAEEEELYRYYGLDSKAGTDRGTDREAGTGSDGEQAAPAAGGEHNHERDHGREDRAGQAGVVGHDTSGPTTDQAMTRSEEQLNVGTRTEEVGRARLRKHVVTEQQTHTVPVSREEVRVEREPITDANRGEATDGPAISEEEHEVVLHAEKPVVQKETVPVERVKLGTETVRGEETVSEEVRKEQIETHDGGTDAGRRTDKP